METRTSQLIARDLFQSLRMGARRIEVLRGISMEILYGEAIFLSGASGAGKTTLLYTLAGLERPESGSVEFEGRRLTTVRQLPERGFATKRWVSCSKATFCCRN